MNEGTKRGRGHPVWSNEQKAVARIMRDLKFLGKYMGPDGHNLLREDLSDLEAQLTRLTEPCHGAAHANPYVQTCPECSGDPAPLGQITRKARPTSEVPVERQSARPGPSVRPPARRRSSTSIPAAIVPKEPRVQQG